MNSLFEQYLDELSSFDWIFLGVIAIISPYIVVLLQKLWKNICMRAMNKNLTQRTNPIKYIVFQVLLLLTIICLLFLFVTITVLYPWSNQYLIFLVIIAILLCFYNIHPQLKRDIDGLVGILSSDVDSIMVQECEREVQDSFFLATHTDDEGEIISYEKRQPIVDPTILENKQASIKNYYIILKNKIDEHADNKDLFNIVYDNKELHVCDFMYNQAYSLDSIVRHVNDTCLSIAKDHSINFIGDKIGVSGYTFEEGKLRLKIYLTDHFTFKVFKNIFLDKDFKSTFQTIILRTNRASENDKELLVETLKYLFSSFGVDIIIHGRRANGQKGVLLAVRNGDIERKRESKIHVPVNESFSRTDQLDDNRYDLQKCVQRGVEEELGIPASLISSDKMSFYDFAIVSDEGEIGLGCTIDLSGIMPLEQARMYPGQDKFMELSNLIIVNHPPFFLDPFKYRNYYFKNNGADVLSFQWESFTPLLYQRFALRNKKDNGFASTFWGFTISVLLFSFYFWLFDIKISVMLSNILSVFLSLISNGIINIIKICKNRREYKTYKCYLPLIPQWGGDAMVIQSTGTNLYRDPDYSNGKNLPVSSNIYFGLISSNNKKVRNINNLVLANSPYCSLRKEGEKDYTEVPISFYRMKELTDEEESMSQLFFREVPFNIIDGELNILLHVERDNNQVHYCFTKTIDITNLSFGTSLSSDEVKCLSRYFSMPASILASYKIAQLPQSFSDNYRLYDLFKYKDNYYWSAWPIKQLEWPSESIKVDNKTSIYESIKKLPIDGAVRICGKPLDVLNALVRFINHPTNRNKISALDIYILQLALIRHGNNSSRLVLSQTTI